MKIIILGRPASKKNSRRNFGHISLPSEAYERFRKDALFQLKKYKERFTVPVALVIEFHQKGRMRQDIDNAESSLLDVLQDSGIIENDGLVLLVNKQIMTGAKEWKTICVIEELVSGNL